MRCSTRRLLARFARDERTHLLAVLVLTAAVYPLVSGLSCGGYAPPPYGSSQLASLTPGTPPARSQSVDGTVGPVAPGTSVSRGYQLTQASAQPPAVQAEGAAALADTVTIRYWPPRGAQDTTFTGLQPTNPQGPPPFLFTGIPAGSPAAVLAHYRAPALPENRARYDAADLFQVVETDGNVEAALRFTPVLAEPPLPAPDAGRGTPEGASAALQPSGGAAAEYSWWRPELYFGAPGVTMTTDLCAGVTAYLQSGSFFVAVRLPLSDAAATVPLVMRYGEPGRYPRLDLIDESVWPPRVKTSLPLELRPEWLEWAENALPHADGEHWATLAPSPVASVTCPAALSLASWEYYASVPVDAGADPTAWDEKVLPVYLCFVGDSPPPLLAGDATALLDALAAGDSSATVTPLGPSPIRLYGDAPRPPIVVHGAGLRRETPPQQVALPFLLENPTSQAATASLAVASRLRLPWELYEGTFEAPDLARKITAPLVIPRYQSVSVWAVADVPEGVGGAETVTLTAAASAAGASTWNTGLLWFGDWPHTGHALRRHLR
jgi:hypothetical protein